MTDENLATRTSEPLFLRIPIARLVLLSILSCGIYEAYWIYEHWAHLKRRDGLKISPFWRGTLCIFFCYSLFKRIHSDVELRSVQEPPFSPGLLAAGWIATIVITNAIDLAPGPIATVTALLVPSYLFFVPVQTFINSAIHKREPAQSYHRWSTGHVLCLVLGLAMWGFTIAPFTMNGDVLPEQPELGNGVVGIEAKRDQNSGELACQHLTPSERSREDFCGRT